MLDVTSIDIGRVLETPSVAGSSAAGVSSGKDDLDSLLSFSLNNGELSEEEMSKLEEDYLSAQSSVHGSFGAWQTEHSFENDGKESERDSNLNQIRSLENAIQTLVSDTQSLISNLFQKQNDGQKSGIQIGKDGVQNESKIEFKLSNDSSPCQEVINKQEDANSKVEELGALVKDTDMLEKQMCASAPNPQEDKTEVVPPTSGTKEQSSGNNSSSGQENPSPVTLQKQEEKSKLNPELQAESDKSSIEQHKKQYQIYNSEVNATNSELASQKFNMTSPFQMKNSHLKECNSLFFRVDE